MRDHKRRTGWWVLLLLLLGGGVVWVLRLLRDDDTWTEAGGSWEPKPVPSPAPGPAPVRDAEPEPDVARTPAPVPTTPEAVRAADDLTRIEGVGPKIAAALVAAGFETYAAVAVATEEDLRAALRTANVRASGTLGTWAEQARALADS
ncbi:helix-hairpin-helix domain-containing protein [Isoptericola sp. b441]|uniref:Helix-hairpin-helix domain-containing protein n=1 Tax=Actinotalea lenta TaxID=3064654 RepID=A0ABT9D5J9_9CELL|nr:MULTISPECIES: helix-hairpin-helix domain-containing protein [unclassified Isoptericola]MDO8106055.1 helix-hairpin-helix domain-containing protein [Isoptericola sp. b441]MDO8122226.1 helix-hairpin-helix domain-containing protein [Isoptericola sp. b490]